MEGLVVKRILLVVLAFALIIFSTACKKNDFEAYVKAVNKTNEIKRGQKSLDFKMNMDFNTEELTSEEIKDLNYFRNFEAKFNVTFDDELKKTIGRNYFNFGGLGFDAAFYNDGEKSFIKMPIVGKYIVLDEKFMENHIKDKDDEYKENKCISDKTIEELESKWVTMIKRENVFAGKESVMTTPDGEVKVTEYTIKLTGEQFKKLLDESIDILLGDEALKETIKEYADKSGYAEADFNFDKALNNLKKSLKGSEIGNLFYTAYMDIDGYIIKENIEFDISFIGEEFNGLDGLKYSLETNLWSIEKEQKFDFPQLTDENTLNNDEIDQGIPFMFESIFEKKE